MLIYDFVEQKVSTSRVRFEYGYYGKGGSFMKDELLSFSGSKEEVLAFLQEKEQLHFLYACGGECNDFECLQDGDTTKLRFIDFR